MTDADILAERSTDTTVLIIVADRDERETYTGWLDDHDTRVAPGDDVSTDTLDKLDDDVDVVVLDGGLTEPDSAELIGRIRARRVGCQIALLSDVSIAGTIHSLDVDEYVPRPVTREELRATVDRLADRVILLETVETYLTLVERKRNFERRFDADELAEQSHYRELTGELVGRRRQIDSLLAQLADEINDADGAADQESVARNLPTEQPLYRTRSREFYGLWALAALTYGLGDIVSTTVAVFGADGINEANPVVDTLFETVGLPGFLVLKLLVFLVLISVSVQGARTHDRFSYYWPPVVTTLLGFGLTTWNIRLILTM